jgi:fatty-acyl-CoA synthase
VILRGPPRPPTRFPTVAHALRAAVGHPSGVTFVDLQEREAFLSWGEVHARAERAAAALAALGIRRGDRVAIVLRTEPAFLDAFLGSWLAGAVPVPLYPPVRLGRMDEYVRSTSRMLEVSGARLVLSRGAVKRLLGRAVELARPELGCRDAEDLLRVPAAPGDLARGRDEAAPPRPAPAREPSPRRSGARPGGPPGEPEEPRPAAPARAGLPRPDDLALVQFSSGSTVDPKPVALTHAAVAAQIDALVAAVTPGPQDALVSWLPLYHDMGLIGAPLGAMSYPGPLVLIAPEHFLARPGLWLRAIARHGGTLSAAPSFAWAYAADRVKDEELRGLSLASWRFALDGAEQVSGEAMRRFAARFERFGFDPAALVPVYGLAEAALAVTFGRRGKPLRGLRVDPVVLARDGLAVPGDREIASVGTPVPGVEVEVRGDGGDPLPQGRLGRIHVRGPSIMREYLGDPEATARALRGGWLDTADLGFVRDGELYVHGRARDVVVVRGANHAPEEFEAALDGIPGVRPGCAVAAGFAPEGAGGEALLLLVERRRRTPVPDEAIVAGVRSAVLERTGIAPHTIRVLEPGTLPRTSSGKLRRAEAARRFAAGELAPPARANALTLALHVARSQLAYARARRRGAH